MLAQILDCALLLIYRTPTSLGPQGHLCPLPVWKSGFISLKSAARRPSDGAPSTTVGAVSSRAKRQISFAGKRSPTVLVICVNARTFVRGFIALVNASR